MELSVRNWTIANREGLNWHEFVERIGLHAADGSASGVAFYPVWNEVRAEQILWRRETYEAQRGPILDPTVPRRWLPVECNVPIRYHWWFWSSTNADSLMSLDRMMEIYYRSVGYGANLLINHTPDPTGLIPEADVRRGAEFGAEAKRRFGLPLAQTHGTGNVFEIDLKRPTRIDHVVLMDAIEHGQRMLEYEVEAMAGNAWQSIVRGDAIGHKKIDRFEPVLAAKVRLRVHKALAEPHLRSGAVFQTGP